jgi:hypothetical protein
MSCRRVTSACRSLVVPACARAIWSSLILTTLASSAGLAQRKTSDITVTAPRALWIRGDEADTSWVEPNQILLVDGRLYMTDPKGPAVIALDATSGRTIWRYSKPGGGPGEMRGPTALSWHPQGIVVVDNANQRLYLFSRTGRLIAEQPAPLGRFVGSLCSLNDGTMIASVATLSGVSVYATRFGAGSPQPYPFPFDTAARRTPLDHAMDLAPTRRTDKYGCLATRKADEGMALLTAGGAASKASYVERIHQRPVKPPEEMRDTSDLPIPFSLKSTISAETAYVWFGGKSCAHRCIDLYSIPGLSYIRSLRIAGPTGLGVRDLTIDNGILAVLGDRDGVPVIAAFRLAQLGGL